MKVVVLALASVLAVAAPRPAQRYVASDSPAARELEAAFSATYNLDFEDGLGHARRAVELDPGNSRTHRGLASIIWARVAFDRGAITVDHALGGISVPPLAFADNNPDLHEEFAGALAEAIRLADRRLKRDLDDVAARYDAGAAYGLQASYMATVEGGYAGAFRYSRRAFDTLSEVLDRDPGFAAAGLITGNYRYSLGSQPAVARFFAFFAGFSGDREKAIALLEAASHDPITRVEAKTSLIQVYSREGRHTEALRVARELGIELPRNRLMQLEEGAAAIRAGRDQDADAVLTRGLAAFEQDPRQKLPGEHALWLYKRGLARLNLDRFAEAAADLRNALGARPLGWMAGRIHLALGNLADLDGRRPEAMSEYSRARDICRASPDARCKDDARLWLRQPFAK